MSLPFVGETLLVDCTIIGNSAVESGGGLFQVTAGRVGELVMASTTICNNTPDNVDGEPVDDGSNLVCSCTGDLNGDDIVDGGDLTILLGEWGPCPAGAACIADVNGDDLVDGADLNMLLGRWGVCPDG